VARPGRMHDQTAVRIEGTADQFRQYPNPIPVSKEQRLPLSVSDVVLARTAACRPFHEAEPSG